MSLMYINEFMIRIVMPTDTLSIGSVNLSLYPGPILFYSTSQFSPNISIDPWSGHFYGIGLRLGPKHPRVVMALRESSK